MKLLRRLDQLCAAVEKSAVVFLFSTLVLLIFFNIASRSVFRASFHQIPEFVPTLVLWLALIGSSLALREARHIKIELLLRFCPEKLQTRLRQISGIFGMLVMGVLFAASLEFLQNEIGIFGPIGWLSVILPIFFALSCFRFLILAVDGKGTRADQDTAAPHLSSPGARRP